MNEINLDTILSNTFKIIKGVLFVIRNKITNFNDLLFQAIKHLSKIRINGKDVMDTICLIDKSKNMAYFYHSEDFLNDIEKVYNKNDKYKIYNVNPYFIYDFAKKNTNKIKEIVQNSSFVKINIDANCVISWSKRYYQTEPKKSSSKSYKEEMFEALKNPKNIPCFKYIYPLTCNIDDFKYIIDKLNPPLKQEKNGAYYTPIEYAKISTQMIKNIIKTINGGYVIIDRCAGTGNLESLESGFNEEILKHTILISYELKEWETLNNRFKDKCLMILPKDTASLQNGLLKDADALNVLVFKEVQKYVDDPNTTIILYENPPYHDSIIGNHKDPGNKVRSKQDIRETLVYEKAKEDLKNWNINNISSIRELANNFIWSGFEYYLKKPNDYYVLYSPIKYWKSVQIPNANKTFIDGYLFNRKHFHAGVAGLSCIAWKNIPSNTQKITLKVYDIINNETIFLKNEDVFKINTLQTKYYDRTTTKKDAIAYIRNNASIIDFKNASLINYAGVGMQNTGFSRGFYVSKDNLLNALVPYCANYYDNSVFYEKDVLMKTADGGLEYTKDEDLKTACLLYACLSNANHCKSFYLKDKNLKEDEVINLKEINGEKIVFNELVLDENTIANNILKTRTLNLNHTNLLSIWNEILNLAKQTKNYNKDFAYSLKQINDELNTYQEVKIGKKTNKVYDYVVLNTKITAFRKILKDYYKNNIGLELRKYGLVK